MKKLLVITGIFFATLMIFQSCYKDNEYDLYPSFASCDSTGATYSGTVAPIMASGCNSCHSGTSASGGVLTGTYAGLSVVAANGKLWGCVSHASGYPAMPPGGTMLSDCDRAKIKNWLNSGHPNN